MEIPHKQEPIERKRPILLILYQISGIHVNMQEKQLKLQTANPI